MRKYNNVIIECDGIKFHSKLEADYYLYLKEQKKQGLIKDFELQPRIQLIPTFKNNKGETVRSINYILDFKILNNDDSVDYVDTKGFETDVSKIKKKLINYLYPELNVSWICRCAKKFNTSGFIDTEELKKIKKEIEKNGKGKK